MKFALRERTDEHSFLATSDGQLWKVSTDEECDPVTTSKSKALLEPRFTFERLGPVATLNTQEYNTNPLWPLEVFKRCKASIERGDRRGSQRRMSGDYRSGYSGPSSPSKSMSIPVTWSTIGIAT
jgi:hypothetical protein